MVADYSHRVGGRHVHGIGSVSVRIKLPRTSQSGLQKPYISDARCTTIQREKAIVQREGITLVNPDWFFHFARECRVLR